MLVYYGTEPLCILKPAHQIMVPSSPTSLRFQNLLHGRVDFEWCSLQVSRAADKLEFIPTIGIFPKLNTEHRSLAFSHRRIKMRRHSGFYVRAARREFAFFRTSPQNSTAHMELAFFMSKKGLQKIRVTQLCRALNTTQKCKNVLICYWTRCS